MCLSIFWLQVSSAAECVCMCVCLAPCELSYFLYVFSTGLVPFCMYSTTVWVCFRGRRQKSLFNPQQPWTHQRSMRTQPKTHTQKHTSTGVFVCVCVAQGAASIPHMGNPSTTSQRVGYSKGEKVGKMDKCQGRGMHAQKDGRDRRRECVNFFFSTHTFALSHTCKRHLL